MKLPFNIQPKRNELQKNALIKAKATYASDPVKYKDIMFCPYCGSPLVKSGKQRRMETLSEHVSIANEVSLKDEYICSAEGIDSLQYFYEKDDKNHQYGCKYGVLHSWNGGWEKGGNYVSEFWRRLYNIRKESVINRRVIDEYFDEDRTNLFGCALNTDECSTEVAIYKNGLRKYIGFPSWLTFNLCRIFIDFDYKANNFGEVTDTYIHFSVFVKSKDGEGFCHKITPFYHTWNYLRYVSKKAYKEAENAKTDNEKLYNLIRAMNIHGNTGWVYRFHQWFEYLIHPKYAKFMKEKNCYKLPQWKCKNI